MKKAIIGLSLAAFATPLISFAAINNLSDAGAFIINTINNILVPVLFAIAFIVFIWGVFQTFILGQGSEESREKGKNLMLYGLIGFVLMIVVWGLVNLITGTLDLGNTSGPTGGLPTSGSNIGQ